MIATSSGCSFERVNFGPTDTATPTADGPDTEVVDPEFFERGKESSNSLPEGRWSQQRISTPHLDFTLEATYAGPTLSAEAAAQVGREGELSAPQGHEFVAIVCKGGSPSYEAESGAAADVKLVVDRSRAINLPAMFDRYSVSAGSYTKEWEFIVLCVPSGADVKLQVTDQVTEPDQAVLVDLRTGVPVNNRGWQQTTGFRDRVSVTCTPDRGVFSRRFTTLDPQLETEGGTLRFGLMPDTASGIFPWIPTLGWAPEGKQWFPVPMNAKIDVVDGEVFPRMEMNIPNSFVYVTEDTQRVQAVHPETATTDAVVRNNGDLIVIWPVSGREEQALLSFDPVGSMVVDYTDRKNVPAGFSADARPLEFELAFTTQSR